MLSICMTAGGCDSRDPAPLPQEQRLPFTIIERDGRLTYALRLPDGGNLLLMANTADGKPAITGASISSSEGIMYSADYAGGEFLIFDPDTKSEMIYVKTDDGFERAPKSVQEKHQQASQLFKDFFGKHVGSHGDTDEAMSDMQILKNRLRELHKRE
jgi:hypothetical protein